MIRKVILIVLFLPKNLSTVELRLTQLTLCLNFDESCVYHTGNCADYAGRGL
ncbi:hypothetical protein R69749_07936 [Paraburkholderia domus]|nr:hypothetical protein R69749_07936 [Paraburkholderia domus]